MSYVRFLRARLNQVPAKFLIPMRGSEASVPMIPQSRKSTFLIPMRGSELTDEPYTRRISHREGF